MRRFWIDSKFVTDQQAFIEGELFHHIIDVCRMQQGSHFELLVPGKAYFVELSELHKKSAIAKIQEERALPQLPLPRVHLVLSLPRFNTFEAVLEKSVELGVWAIHPVVSEFSFVKKRSAITDSRLQRWQKIIRGATQQSGRGELMQVHPVLPLADLIKTLPSPNTNPQTKAVGLFLYEGAGDLDLSTALTGLLGQGPEDIWLFVGSEGGFSDAEVADFRQLGLAPITMGHQVLRVETACVALVAILKYQFGHLTQ